MFAPVSRRERRRGSATKFTIPFTNLMGAYVFRYLQFYAQIAGTTPSITLSAWISPDLA